MAKSSGNNIDQEIEAKFAVRDLSAFAARLEAIGAARTGERVYENNLRFDTRTSELTAQRRVLRLRQDTAAVMTYKGPARPGEEVASRQEIEFQVSDFAAAQRLLEALGYHVSVRYEKFRTTYQYRGLEIVLDEMPFGSFVEIEGPDAGSIHTAASQLGLDWEARCSASYMNLFYTLVEARKLSARNLTFDELRGVDASPADLGLRYAD